MFSNTAADKSATEITVPIYVAPVPAIESPSSTVSVPPFKSVKSFEERKAESSRMLSKYPTSVPIICEKLSGNKIAELDKKKFLVPESITVGQFIAVIRKRIDIDASEGLYVFINNMLPPTGDLMSSVYAKNKDDDGFLYLVYSSENTFGKTF
jgi:GABA(A) receptor-associated protein